MPLAQAMKLGSILHSSCGLLHKSDRLLHTHNISSCFHGKHARHIVCFAHCIADLSTHAYVAVQAAPPCIFIHALLYRFLATYSNHTLFEALLTAILSFVVLWSSYSHYFRQPVLPICERPCLTFCAALTHGYLAPAIVARDCRATS